MVFAHVCQRKGTDRDILEMLMEDIGVLGQRQIVFKSDQVNPDKAAQREATARRPEMKPREQPHIQSAANQMMDNEKKVLRMRWIIMSPRRSSRTCRY